MDSTSVSLLHRLRTPNDDRAWERFVELYTPLMDYWVRKIGVPVSDAPDLVQSVFATLVKELPKFQYDRGKPDRSGDHLGFRLAMTIELRVRRKSTDQSTVPKPAMRFFKRQQEFSQPVANAMIAAGKDCHGKGTRMDSELKDRAETIQQQIVNLRDSL